MHSHLLICILDSYNNQMCSGRILILPDSGYQEPGLGEAHLCFIDLMRVPE